MNLKSKFIGIKKYENFFQVNWRIEMVKSVKIKEGKAEVEIKMDSIVYQTIKSLLLSEVDKKSMESMGYEYTHCDNGEGFEIFLELGIAHFIKNKTTLETDLKKAKSTILDDYKQIAGKEAEIFKKIEEGTIDMDILGYILKSEENKILIVTKVINKINDDYDGRNIPKNILISEIVARCNITKIKTEQILRLLKKEGKIFESSGYYKWLNY